MLGAEAFDAATVTFNYMVLCYGVTLGIAIGGATRVGNFVGEGDHVRAKFAAQVLPVFGSAIIVALCVLTLALRSVIPRIYVADTVSRAVTLFVMFVF